LSFVVQCVVRGLLTRDLTAVLCTTSPPFATAAGLFIGRVRRVPVHYWLMDINPDQALATGQLRKTSPLVKGLDWLNRQALRRAATIISLDRYMEDRMRSKVDDPQAAMAIVPPWPLDSRVRPVDHTDNSFRERHGLSGKRVVMYSGNHSPVHPLNTLLAAASRLEHREDLVFAFVGGGLEKRRVDDAIAAGARNLLSLPYQPLEEIATSLAAADIHVVVLGNQMRGIVHPSKVYNAMLVGRPLLYVGPRPSHVTDLMDRHDIGWEVAHGDIEQAVEALTAIADADTATLQKLGQRAREAVLGEFDPTLLSDRLCSLVMGS
jgi:glycosyltransferase involved in cell wall biosynthesis